MWSSYQYKKSHCWDSTVVISSYLHNGISYTGKTTSLYWINAQVLCLWRFLMNTDRITMLVSAEIQIKGNKCLYNMVMEITSCRTFTYIWRNWSMSAKLTNFTLCYINVKNPLCFLSLFWLVITAVIICSSATVRVPLTYTVCYFKHLYSEKAMIWKWS